MAKSEKPMFTKEQLLGVDKYLDKQDLLNALLNDNDSYTLEDVEAIVENYLKGEVK